MGSDKRGQTRYSPLIALQINTHALCSVVYFDLSCNGTKPIGLLAGVVGFINSRTMLIKPAMAWSCE